LQIVRKPLRRTNWGIIQEHSCQHLFDWLWNNINISSLRHALVLRTLSNNSHQRQAIGYCISSDMQRNINQFEKATTEAYCTHILGPGWNRLHQQSLPRRYPGRRSPWRSPEIFRLIPKTTSSRSQRSTFSVFAPPGIKGALFDDDTKTFWPPTLADCRKRRSNLKGCTNVAALNAAEVEYSAEE